MEFPWAVATMGSLMSLDDPTRPQPYDVKDIKRSKELLIMAGQKGIKTAYSILGDIARELKDMKEAAEWWSKSLEVKPDDVNTRLWLAALYREGKDVPKDEKKLFAVLEPAAAKEDGQALVELGWCYEDGLGCEKNVAKAKELYKKASSKGWSHLAGPELDRLVSTNSVFCLSHLFLVTLCRRKAFQ
jgi:TPR repeat protein